MLWLLIEEWLLMSVAMSLVRNERNNAMTINWNIDTPQKQLLEEAVERLGWHEEIKLFCNTSLVLRATIWSYGSCCRYIHLIKKAHVGGKKKRLRPLCDHVTKASNQKSVDLYLFRTFYQQDMCSEKKKCLRPLCDQVKKRVRPRISFVSISGHFTKETHVLRKHARDHCLRKKMSL